MTARKFWTLVLIALLIFFVVNSPTDAANVVKNTQHLIGHGFQSISQFIKSL